MNSSRRQFLATSIAMGAIAALPIKLNAEAATPAAAPVAKPAPLPSLKGKKILVVWGGWQGHEPEKCVKLLAPWMEAEGATLTISNSLDSYLDEALMSSVDLIVQTVTQSELTKKQEENLLGAVKAGCGIAGWHGGLGDSFRKSAGYGFMVGGQWVAHPGGIIDYTVNITDHDDPVTHGLKDFVMHSEQYYMLVDPNTNVLATTAFSDKHANWIKGCVMPVVWKKTFGKGRVFYSSLCHVASDFNVPEALTIMQRGICWASASKYEPTEAWVTPKYGKQ